MVRIQTPLFPRQPKRSEATAKLPTWQPSNIPMSQEERREYWKFCIEAIFSIWNTEHRPAHLSEIFPIVRKKVMQRQDENNWPYPGYRCKRTVDRRVNEVASPAFYEDKEPLVVAVTNAIYQPNPILFQ